jgi:hypothetical protein
MSWVLLVAGTALAICAAPVLPAVAATSGAETFSGTIVFAPVPGTTSRTVIGSVVRATGAFKAVGQVVELAPPNAGVSQEELVFPAGTLLVTSTGGSLQYTINPHSCLFTGTQEFTWQVTGGTGPFQHAAGTLTGTVSTEALLPRNPDRTCSFAQPRHEVDKFTESGTLSF